MSLTFLMSLSLSRMTSHPHLKARMFGARFLSHLHLLFLVTSLLLLLPLPTESACRRGCDVALASYYVTPFQNLSNIASLFGFALRDIDPKILPYNRHITTKDSIPVNTRINIPFPCDCIDDGAYLGHAFQYIVRPADTYDSIAKDIYANLTTGAGLAAINRSPSTPNTWAGSSVNVIVNCSCGDASVSEDYGLFATYPLRAGQDLDSVAREIGLPDAALLQRYNPTISFSSGSGIAFVPAKDRDGNFSRLITSTGEGTRSEIPQEAIAGICVAAVVLLILVAGIAIIVRRRSRKKSRTVALLPSTQDPSSAHVHEVEVVANPQAKTSPIICSVVEKIVKFSLKELKRATNDFSLGAKIGEGGFGEVFYGEIRGEKTAIKKMKVEESVMFLAELKVLSRFHHMNLVRLIGYCTKDALFLVYEYIENGNLNQHLHGSGNKDPLPWSTRIQIALDSAQGLEYIHEKVVPSCTHGDIKPANILIDKNYHAKVADFGLAQLIEAGNSQQQKKGGTPGYMAPESRYDVVTPKGDVYAFGVVLYELVSAQKAVVMTNAHELATEVRALVHLFNEVFANPDPRDHLRKLVDPRLGNDYPFEDVYKLAQIANFCTHEKAQRRPSMGRVVVALRALSSNEDSDVSQFFENPGRVRPLSGDSTAFP